MGTVLAFVGAISLAVTALVVVATGVLELHDRIRQRLAERRAARDTVVELEQWLRDRSLREGRRSDG